MKFWMHKLTAVMAMLVCIGAYCSEASAVFKFEQQPATVMNSQLSSDVKMGFAGESERVVVIGEGFIGEVPSVGEDIPLDLALTLMVPQDWKVLLDSSVRIEGIKTSWSGTNRLWTSVLEEAARNYNLRFIVDHKQHKIFVFNEDRPQEKLEQLENERRAIEEARLEKKRQLEAERKAEEETRLKAERAVAEQARLEAERKAAEEARLKAKRAAAEQARLEAERKAAEEARLKAKREAAERALKKRKCSLKSGDLFLNLTDLVDAWGYILKWECKATKKGSFSTDYPIVLKGEDLREDLDMISASLSQSPLLSSYIYEFGVYKNKVIHLIIKGR